MNTDNINKTISVLKEISRLEDRHGQLFDMTVYGEDLPIAVAWLQLHITCDTVGCIAGWACVASERELESEVTDADPYLYGMEIWHLAVAFLELPEDLAQDLFTPDISNELYVDITAQDAIKVLEILRDTGEVRWEEVLHWDKVLDGEHD